MKNFLLICFAAIYSLQTFASEVWLGTTKPVSHDQIDELTDKYRALIRDADIVAAYDTLLAHPASPSQMAIILDLDSMARAASLNGNFQKAFNYYVKLGGLLKEFPNVSGLEKITLSTKINLAHMATLLKRPDSEKRWRDAHAWAPDAVLSPEEFSPTVILKFSKPLLVAKRQKILLKTTPEVSLFVDGQRLKSTEHSEKVNYFVFLEPGTHQVSALAPGVTWSIMNFKVSGQKMSFNIRPTPLISGTCDDPHIFSRDIPPKTKVLGIFSDDCAKVYFKNSWYNIEGAKLNLPVQEVHLTDSLKPSEPTTTLRSSADKRSFISKLTGSGWFWAGLGAAVLGAIVISNNQSTTVPTHTVQ